MLFKNEMHTQYKILGDNQIIKGINFTIYESNTKFIIGFIKQK